MVKFRSFLILFMFGTFSFFSLFSFRVISFKCCFCDFTFCFCELLSFSENLTNFVIPCEMNFMIFASKSFSRKSHASRQLCTAQPALAAQSEKPAQSAKHEKKLARRRPPPCCTELDGLRGCHLPTYGHGIYTFRYLLLKRSAEDDDVRYAYLCLHLAQNSSKSGQRVRRMRSPFSGQHLGLSVCRYRSGDCLARRYS